MNAIKSYMNQRTFTYLLVLAIIVAIPLMSFQKQANNMSQNDPYQKEWKEIDSLENQGLPRSALEKVEVLYERSKKEKQDAQFVKTIMYKGRLNAQLTEDGIAGSIRMMQEELDQSIYPITPVLHSLIADLYHQYTENNYWRLRDRTNTVGFEPDKLESYSLAQLQEKSSGHYIMSVKDERTTSILIEDFAAITYEGEKNTDELRPTLYDFLAHRAIRHFSNDRSHISQPASAFVINQPAAFLAAKAFVGHEFVTTDSNSYQYKTLLLFQQLLDLRLEKGQKAALLHADLSRLKFVKDKCILSNKDSLYLEALKALEKDYKGNPAEAEIWYYQAKQLKEQGDTYVPGNDTHKWKLKEALELCHKATEEYPDSYGAGLAKLLGKSLSKRSVSVQVETVNLPNAPVLSSVTYRNVSNLYLRLVKLDENQLLKLENRRSEEVHAELIQLPVFREWKEVIPNDGDLQEHKVELAIDQLPLGVYALLVADNEGFELNSEASGYLFTHVSRIAYLNRRIPNGGLEFVVVDRETGAPLVDVEATYYEQKYNRRRRETERIKIGNGRTDKEGFLRPDFKSRNYFQLRLAKGDDVLFFNDGYSTYRSTDNRRQQVITHFFLDRAIYRPGQNVYYKVIALTKDKSRMPEIMPNHDLTITLYDVNGQEVSSQQLKTNEYGAANGVFTAPKGGLLGQMRLQSSAGNSRQYFSVEEYKRPKFEVVMDPLEGSPALEEEVTVSGKASNFAGSSVDGAAVNYRVVREVNYPWWPWWRRPGPYRGQSQEIAAGTTITDEGGAFSIDFIAKPDPTVNKENKPEFVYSVYVDVVDITGETHSATKQVRLAYLGLKTDVVLPDAFDRNGGLLEIDLVVQNLDGEKQAAKGKLSIHRLNPPQRLFVDRYWQQPDQHIMDANTFRSKFAHYAYKEEDKPSSWEKAKEIYSESFDTGKADSVVVNASGLTVGHYEIKMLVEDDKGNEIESIKYLKVYDHKNKQLPAGIVAWHEPASTSYQPGDEADIVIATTDATFNVLYELERQGTLIEQAWMDEGSWKTATHKVLEADKGNIYAHLSAVKFNRAFTWKQNILVPWDDKKLEFHYSTFRDKLKPGQEESWQITIKGPENEQLAAEMVAAMYDASLDQFRPNRWDFAPFPTYFSRFNWQAVHFNAEGTNPFVYQYYHSPNENRSYRQLNWFGGFVTIRGARLQSTDYYVDGIRPGNERAMTKSSAPAPMAMEEAAEAEMDDMGALETRSLDAVAANVAGVSTEKPVEEKAPPVRTNLKETVFFFPELRTDEAGNVVIRFTMNEALTRWKFLGLAHTPDLKYALTEREVVTQKELMVLPNPPRFFREGDRIVYTAKVSNLTESAMKGNAKLQLFNALTMEPVDALLGNTNANKPFSAPGGQSAALSWEIEIPVGEVMAITHRVVAEAGNFADGEEAVLPVLTNRVLVTESMPMPVKGGEERTFTFEAMEKAAQSTTLQHHNFTLEFTSNPAWYAVKALPYLMEYPHQCSEQIFSRYYANSLAASIANSSPALERVFEQWKSTNALVSELQKNEELKSILLQETPWVVQAQNEAEQRKRIGLLFDLNRMSYEQDNAVAQLDKRQAGNGGFAWFPGGRESWYITQYILEGFGRLKDLGVQDVKPGTRTWNIASKATRFVDQEFVGHYEDLMKRIDKGYTKKEDNHLSSIVIHYLYARSLFPELPIRGKAEEAVDYYLEQAEEYWLQQGLYNQGLLALSLQHYDKKEVASSIVKSLRERALYDDEQGMYWKSNYGYLWYELPIETHSLMVEVFAKVAQDNDAVEQLKIWLLKNKQTNHWKTTKATANAVYALLRFGDDWLIGTELADIKFPDMKRAEYEPALAAAKKGAEAGTGYFKASWDGKVVNSSFDQIKVKNNNDAIAWGAAYWQYFEDLDKVKVFEDTPLKLKKKLFKEINGSNGPELIPLSDEKLEPGDKLVVRIELEVDRTMEYVHLKDHRASGLEPMNVFSQYKWQGGLGYYESTRDAATHFFMDYLPKGSYVFEYPLRVVHKGDFSNGMASIECMYAPEFKSHSEGQRVVVE